MAQSNYFSEGSKTIAILGIQGTYYYFGVAEGVGQTCLGGLVYVVPERKPMYAALLAAKLTGKRLSRLDYSITNGQCWAEIVEINN